MTLCPWKKISPWRQGINLEMQLSMVLFPAPLAPIRVTTSPGFTDELVYLYLAGPVVPHAHGTDHDDGERILDVRAFRMGELRDRVASGAVQDSLTLALFARLSATGIADRFTGGAH